MCAVMVACFSIVGRTWPVSAASLAVAERRTPSLLQGRCRAAIAGATHVGGF
ncbi:MAG: hypothetical protein M9939_02420 [Mesorhizobium sp.]|nr:hypothetical protein [Mesorhizobium sp.]MCO5159964.1 hypothetical protein [Mesorhizobium sp.]